MGVHAATRTEVSPCRDARDRHTEAAIGQCQRDRHIDVGFVGAVPIARNTGFAARWGGAFSGDRAITAVRTTGVGQHPVAQRHVGNVAVSSARRDAIRTGQRPSPRYFETAFSIGRAPTPSRKRPPDDETVALIDRVRALRAEGLSHPAIAWEVGISVGTAWKYTQEE